MSRLSELHHETALLTEPPRPYTMDEWAALRDRCAKEAWAETNLTLSFDYVWRITDAVLREAMPERVPEEGR